MGVKRVYAVEELTDHGWIVVFHHEARRKRAVWGMFWRVARGCGTETFFLFHMLSKQNRLRVREVIETSAPDEHKETNQ